MSTTAPDNRITPYSPLDATTSFAAEFPIFDNADITVIHNGVERFDFTVSASYVEGISNDARVVFAVGIVGDVLIVGSRSPRRNSRFVNGSPLPIWMQNLAIDTLKAESQEAERDIGRALKVSFGAAGYTVDSEIETGAVLVVDGDRIKGGPNAEDVAADAEAAAAAAQASAAAAALSQVAAASSAASAAGSAISSAVSADDSEAAAIEAEALVQQATAGFIGFVDGLGYDFGSVADPITYFDQDWGSI